MPRCVLHHSLPTLTMAATIHAALVGAYGTVGVFLLAEIGMIAFLFILVPPTRRLPRLWLSFFLLLALTFAVGVGLSRAL